MKNIFTIKDQAKLDKALDLCQKGFLSEGKIYLTDLKKKFPSHPAILTPLGTVSIQQGFVEEAVFNLERSLKFAPDQIYALNALGNAFIELKKYNEAIHLFQKAISINSNYLDPFYNQGRAYSALKKYDEAKTCYEFVLSIEPKCLWALISMGFCFYKIKKYEDAINLYKQALDINPNVPEIYNNLGLVYDKLGKVYDAITSFNQAIKLKRDFKDAYVNLSDMLLRILDYDEFFVKNYIEKTLESDTNPDSALFLKSHLLENHGEFETANDIRRKLIESNSQYSDFCFLAILRSKKIDSLSDPFLKQMECQLSNNSDYEKKINLNFALGKAYEDLKVYNKSFEHYKEANDLRLKDAGDDFNQELLEFKDIINFYNNTHLDFIKSYASDSNLPILIFGMPRSGTTLVEQIISSHPSVGAGGESPFWISNSNLNLINTLVKKDEREAWSAVQNNYLTHLNEISDSKDKKLKITDKQPHNFMHLGLIASLFPKAKLVHCKRDAADNCWSIFTLNFNKNHRYAQSLENLAKYYLAYEELMHFWEINFPNRIMSINYEDLVENTEYWTKELIKYIELPWSDLCLSPHKNQRSVKTPSNWQIRQPIYKTSIKRSDYFSDYIGPMKNILET